MNVILFGFKNCGKTNLAKELAKKLDRPFLDTDDLIEGIYLERYGKNVSYRNIAKKHGMDVFRELEKEAVKRLSGLQEQVFATGGGTPLFFDNKEKLKACGKMVLLRVNKEEVYKRILEKGIPSFFDKENPRQSFEKIFSERMGKFEEMADFIVDCDHKSRSDMADEIVEYLKSINKKNSAK